jgi:hypothetical protein
MRRIPASRPGVAWMPTRRDALRAAASCAACILAGQVPAAEVDYGALIDMAGRQRMLTQRIVKAYAQVGLGVTPDASHAQLRTAVRRFETQLGELGRRAPVAAARPVLERVDALWRPLRRVVLGPVHREGAQWLAAHDEALLGAAHELVGVLEASAGTALARLVTLAGRQRMLSQRLAKLYMLQTWGIEVAGADDDMATAQRDFAQALATLQQAPENTPAIAQELDAIALQWDWFAAALTVQRETPHALVVADASESILEGMERVAAMYAKTARLRG